MATAKKHQNGELSDRIIGDVSNKKESGMTSQSTESLKKHKKTFSHDSGSTTEDEGLEKSDTSNNSSKNFNDNQHEGLFMITSNKQSDSFNPTTNLVFVAYRQHEVQNNQLVFAMLDRGESIY